MYKCIKCQYETKVKANYEKHLKTIKHLKTEKIETNEIEQKRIIKWNKRNELIDMYLHKDIWRTRMVYLLVDIRDILGRPII